MSKTTRMRTAIQAAKTACDDDAGFSKAQIDELAKLLDAFESARIKADAAQP